MKGIERSMCATHLLEPQPEKRLGGGKHSNTAQAAEDVKNHKYWNDPEWPLVELARLPSPLMSYLEARSLTKTSETKLRKQQRAAVDTATKMAAVERKLAQAKEDAAAQKTEAERAARLAMIDEKVEDLKVDGWEFVSQHAVEAEYVETIASSVSLL